MTPPPGPVEAREFATWVGGRQALLHAVRDLVGKAAPQFLVRSGGYRRERVIAAGRRQTARLWDEPVRRALGPWRYDAACIDLLVTIHNLAAGGAHRSGEDPRDPPAARLPEPAPCAKTWADAIFFHAVVSRLPALDGVQIAPAQMARLAAGSPLTALTHPHRLGGETAAPLGPLLEAGEGVLLTFLARHIARRWADAATLADALDPAACGEAIRALARAMTALFAAAVELRREHLLRVFGELYRLLVRERGPADRIVQRLIDKSAALETTHERETFLDAAAGLFGSGERLSALADQVRGSAYVERTEAQRLFLQDFQEIYAPVAGEVQRIHQRLRRVVG